MKLKIDEKSKIILPARHKKVSKLCEIRLAKELRQEDIAIKLGCTKSLYAQFERGGQSFNNEQIDIIKNIFNLKSPKKIFKIVNDRYFCLPSQNKYYTSKLLRKRVEKKLSQEEAAKGINISRATYNRIERGHNKIKRDKAYALCEMLSTDMNVLFVSNNNDDLLSVKLSSSKK
jgi:transcriptional regulator with XRE-family HTH domain